MKSALVIIPKEFDIDRGLYLQACADKVTSEQFMPVTPPLYESTPNHQEQFVEKIAPFMDALCFMIDFGIDQGMFRIIDKYCVKIEHKYLLVDDFSIYSPGFILREVSRKTGITVTELRSSTRKRKVVDARNVYFRRCREKTSQSFEEIGSIVNKDHATAMHGDRNARTITQIIDLYNQCYNAPPKIEKEAMGVVKSTFDSQPVERPVLPQRSMDPREQNIPQAKPTVQTVREDGFGGGFRGYRPHNT